VTALLELVALAATGVAAVAFAERTAVAIACTGAAFIATEATPTPLLRHNLSFGGFAVTPLDLVSIALLGAAFLRLSHGMASRRLVAPTLIVLLLLSVHLARGVSAFGVQAAIAGGRTPLWFVAGLLYGSTARWTSREFAALTLVSVSIVPLVLFGYASKGFHSSTTVLVINGTAADSRPVTAAAALLILQGLILVLVLQIGPRGGARVALIALMALQVVLLQHRTVWACALAVGAVGVLLWFRSRPALKHEQTCAVISAACFALPLTVWGVLHTSALVSSFREAQGPRSTLAWRTESWTKLLGHFGSLSDRVFGVPAGTSFERTVFGTQTAVQAHSMYVETILRFGIPGLILLVAAWASVVRRARLVRTDSLPTAGLYALVLTQAVFSVAYSLSIVEGVILGALLAALEVQTAPQRVPLRAGSPSAVPSSS
jgi:hypothetical protein